MYTAVPSRTKFTPIPKKLTSGKLYEAFVLGHVAERLTTQEGLTLRLSAGKNLRLKSSPGPINRAFPHIDVFRNGHLAGEIWTDIEFTTLSYATSFGGSAPRPGQYHELDIAVLRPAQSGRPPHDSVMLGIECKNTGYEKNMLKEILGVRRELSLLSDSRPTAFARWPRTTVPAHPPCCLMVFATDAAVTTYTDPGTTFGIDFEHLPM
jgi:hypothetical protein